MMLSQANFFVRYRKLDTEALLQLLATRELTDAAFEAARLVLIERGISGDRLELEYQQALKGLARRAGVTHQCDFRGDSIAIGGAIPDGGQRFCSQQCRGGLRLYEVAFDLAPDLVHQHAMATFMGPCPICAREGKPVEVRPRWLVASLIWRLADKIDYELCCRRCAQRRNWRAIGTCLLFGWWSLGGLFATPIAIYRNLVEMYATRFRSEPSPQLLTWASLDLARRLDGPMKRIAERAAEN